MLEQGGRPPVDERLSIGYVIPGHNLLSTAGPTRNVLSLAAALAERDHVTVAFRRVLDRVTLPGVDIAEIEPGVERPSAIPDDAALRGVGVVEFLRFMRALRRFARVELSRHDVVLEKSWLLSGYVSRLCRRRGIPAIPVENLVPVSSTAKAGSLKAVRIGAGRRLAGRFLRSSPIVVAETRFLKEDIVRRWKVDPERIEVIGLGVDRARFRPRDQAEARSRLGIPESAMVLLYVGVLDRAHDLRPVLDSVRRLGHRALGLEVVGDGAMREELERSAGPGTPNGSRIRFHGRVPHEEVPLYIAAADLCLAPYDPAAFSGGVVGYSTLKVREYLASGRPVATVRSGSLEELVRDGVSGFLLDGTDGWGRFLERDLPSRTRLREMGAAAAATSLWSWEDAAHAYRHLCLRAVRDRRRE